MKYRLNMIRTTHGFKVFILVLVFVISDAYICLKSPLCSCYKATYTNVKCSGVENAWSVLPAVNQFDHIDWFQMSGSLTSLVAGVFSGKSVAEIAIYGPLETIDEDALKNIKNLEEITLWYAKFDKIPEGIRIDKLKRLYMIRGDLKEIGSELQNITEMTNLFLSFNKIAYISSSAFIGLSHLEVLNLSFNELSSLDPEFFTPLKNLRIIDLSSNQLIVINECFKSVSPQVINFYNNSLTNIDNVFHPGMWEMKELNLGGNPSLNLSSALFDGIAKSLVILNLEDNHFQTLDPQLLKYFPRLYELNLSGNDLDYLSFEFFRHTPLLNTIDLSDNKLKSTEALFADNKLKLEKVKLDGNRLAFIKGGNSSESIISLDLSRNTISELRNSDFQHLSSLNSLNLSGNPIEGVHSDAFEVNHRLNSIDLSYTKLTELNRSLTHVNSLSRLWMNSSQLQYIDDEELAGLRFLKYVHLRNNSLRTVHGVFTHVPMIYSLDISSNNLTTLTEDSFPKYRGTLVHLLTLQMADNPWICDCRMSWIPHWLEKRGELLDDPICEAPAYLRGRNISSLSQTELDLWRDDCPESCECLCLPDGEDVSILVDCFNRSVSEFPNKFPIKAEEIDLANCKIDHFDGLGDEYEKLRLLNLESNRLSKFNLSLPSSVRELLLAKNDLRLFPLEDWEKNSLNATTLSQNPWTCDCDHGWRFREWLNAHNNSVLDLQEVRCGPQEQFSLRNKVIIYLKREDFCPHLTTQHIAAITALGIIVLILLVLCVCLRKWIAALLYSCGCTFLKKKKTFQEPYDVFILYSEQDEEMALAEIAEGLESTTYSFNVCIPCRDIPEPRTAERISAYIAQCSKTVVLLTRNFLADDSSIHLLRSAMSFSLEDSSRQIILVTHGSLPPSFSLDPSLATLLQSCDRLRWGSVLFWPRLVYLLPRKCASSIETYPSTVALMTDST